MSKQPDKRTVARKVIEAHLVEGKLEPGEPISIRIDQTLTQDATGTMAYLHFEHMGIDKVRTELSVSYVDHNTLQAGGPNNANDHLYLQSVARKYGIYFSKAGNGICHQVHLERFAQPGKTLLGSDSHTPTAGGIGSLGIGAGGMDVALAMAGEPFHMRMPKIVGVHLTGSLPPMVAPKDVILELLRRVGVKGGKGKLFEYFGPGIRTLSVPDRATITNMGTETGATSSIFPSDEVTLAFMVAQSREYQWREIRADEGAEYDEVINIDLSSLEPLAAEPHSPGNVVPVRKLKNVKVHQVAIGSCTNSSYKDLVKVAEIFRRLGARVHPEVSAAISPGSKQVLLNLIEDGYYEVLLKAGFRILECACGPCIGMGFAPPSGGVSVRTFNRNFEGRSGTKDALVYLVSPETAAATAITGYLTDPRELGIDLSDIELPERFIIDDSMIIAPAPLSSEVEVIKPPNINYVAFYDPIPERYQGSVLIKLGDNISTDHILPGGANILPLRSNIPAISEYTFHYVDKDFVKRAKELGGGIIIGGENYGQGSSREHAAIAPRYLGVRAVIAKSFARIHKDNLVNFGILPLLFLNSEDYDKVEQGDKLEIIVDNLAPSAKVIVKNLTKNLSFETVPDISERDAQILKHGGILGWIRAKHTSKVPVIA